MSMLSSVAIAALCERFIKVVKKERKQARSKETKKALDRVLSELKDTMKSAESGYE